MDEEIRKSLYDIEIAINSIGDYVGASDNFEDFRSKKIVKRAVEREFEIIGEAINRILKIDPDIEITDSRKIVSLRNYIIHANDNVVDEILWSIIIKNLPLLKQEVNELMNEPVS